MMSVFAETKPSSPSTRPTPPSDRILNLVPSTGTDTDWRFDDAAEAGLLSTIRRPAEVDLRATWWGVGDQGATGSCVGWAAADGVGRYVMVKAGVISQIDRLSPRFIWMSSKETDEFNSRPTTFVEQSGTSLKAAVEVGHKFGFALESELPFAVDTVMFKGSENALYVSAAQRRTSYVNLAADRDRWKDWLADKGPILAGLSVDRSFTELGSDGVLKGFDPSRVLGGHAVAIVGYRPDGTFIIRNSWGTTQWGDAGFAYASPEYLDAAFYPESYGVLVS